MNANKFWEDVAFAEKKVAVFMARGDSYFQARAAVQRMFTLDSKVWESVDFRALCK